MTLVKKHKLFSELPQQSTMWGCEVWSRACGVIEDAWISTQDADGMVTASRGFDGHIRKQRYTFSYCHPSSRDSAAGSPLANDTASHLKRNKNRTKILKYLQKKQ